MTDPCSLHNCSVPYGDLCDTYDNGLAIILLSMVGELGPAVELALSWLLAMRERGYDTTAPTAAARVEREIYKKPCPIGSQAPGVARRGSATGRAREREYRRIGLTVRYRTRAGARDHGSLSGNSKLTSLFVSFLYTSEKVSSFASTLICSFGSSRTLSTLVPSTLQRVRLPTISVG